MDITFLILVLASMVFVYFLARERGRRPSRWVAAASIVGPLAIPVLYLAEAGSALRKMIGARRSWRRKRSVERDAKTIGN